MMHMGPNGLVIKIRDVLELITGHKKRVNTSIIVIETLLLNSQLLQTLIVENSHHCFQFKVQHSTPIIVEHSPVLLQ
jgi:hypothetical protein